MIGTNNNKIKSNNTVLKYERCWHGQNWSDTVLCTNSRIAIASAAQRTPQKVFAQSKPHEIFQKQFYKNSDQGWMLELWKWQKFNRIEITNLSALFNVLNKILWWVYPKWNSSLSFPALGRESVWNNLFYIIVMDTNM